MTSLQDKIDLDIQLIMDNEFINEVYEKYGLSLSEIRDKLLKMEREHIQELREEISNLLLQYKNNYTNCEIIGYENSYLKGRIESLKDVLALIGEKRA